MLIADTTELLNKVIDGSRTDDALEYSFVIVQRQFVRYVLRYQITGRFIALFEQLFS